MQDAKERKIAVVSFALLFAVVIFANAFVATKEIKQSPVLLQSMLQTSQKEIATESEEVKEKKKENSINVGMTLIVTGSIVIIVAGSSLVAQYRKKEAFK